MKRINCKPYSKQELYLQVANTQYLWALVQCTRVEDWWTGLVMNGVEFTHEQFNYMKLRIEGEVA